MNKKTLTILLVMLAIGVVLAFLIPVFVRQGVVLQEDPMIKILEHRNDSLAEVNKTLSKRDSVISIENDSLKRAVSENNVKVVYLNNNKNEKIRVIDGYSNNELYLFFSNTVTKGNN